jgi:hypothetical protein
VAGRHRRALSLGTACLGQRQARRSGPILECIHISGLVKTFGSAANEGQQWQSTASLAAPPPSSVLQIPLTHESLSTSPPAFFCACLGLFKLCKHRCSFRVRRDSGGGAQMVGCRAQLSAGRNQTVNKRGKNR